MNIKVSTGEILDKLSILSIKLKNIQDPNKIKNIITEHIYLSKKCQKFLNDKTIYILYEKLLYVNNILWNIENDIRKKEKYQSFDEEFIELARNVYINNDIRSLIKKEINTISKSDLSEEKLYEQY